jgi:hypothetical protein
MKSRLFLVLFFAAAVTGALGQSGVGAKFGARDPRTCASRKEPAKGAPTAGQLKEYFICDVERVTNSVSGDTLWLLTNVSVEVGKGRPFNIVTDSWPEIDPSQTVYPVRGGHTYFQCTALGKIGGDPGKNCFKYEQPHASGICYKSTFGDWHCKMSDNDATGTTMEKFPPPAGN